ncbi:hypothetical protein GF314_15095 [bacterium]|nr:hypothetical protein [bacterium]
MRRAMGMSRRLAGWLTAAMLLAATAANGLDDGGGRSVFATGAGNRALALGGAYTAVADDASAAIWNPAGLARATRNQLQASQTELFGLGFSEQYAALALPHWRWGTAAVTYRRFGVDGIEGRDERGFLFDDDLEDAETEIALAYAHGLADGALALGGTLKLQTHELAGYSDSGLGADLGMWARPFDLVGASFGADELAFGLALRNIVEPTIKLDRDAVADPLTVRMGLAWIQHMGPGVVVLASGDLERSRDMDSRVHLGVEGRLHDVLALRAGSSDGVLTAGAGLIWRGIGADYQYEDHELGDVHRFGISLGFGASTSERRQAALAAESAALQDRLDAAFADRMAGHVDDVSARIDAALTAARWNDALDALGTLAVIAPDHPGLVERQATAWCGIAGDREQRGSLDEATVAYRRALALRPDHELAAAGLERVQAESSRRAARSQQVEGCYESALVAFADGDLRIARDGFVTVLELAPDDADAATMLERTEAAIATRSAGLLAEATEFAQAGQLDLARARIDAARDLDREAPGLAMAEAALRRAAAQAVPRAIEPAADVPTGQDARGAVARTEVSDARRRELQDLYRRGVEAMQDGRGDEAMRYWEIVLAGDPDHVRAREHLAQEYLTRGMEAYAAGRLSSAVESWQQALRIAPDDARARGYLERAQQQLERMEQISDRR